MKLQVNKAYADAEKATISLSAKVRNQIESEHGVEVRPGYAVNVDGGSKHCPRNLIVLRMRSDDALLKKSAVARLGTQARRRLGVKTGGYVNVTPLKYETWYHGTKAPDPLNTIVRGKWLVGGSNYGVWTSDLRTMAQGYVGTGLLTLEIAWGESLQVPLADHLKAELNKWCLEHGEDYSAIASALPQTASQAASWFQLLVSGSAQAKSFLRWARLYGHYFVPYANARIFPGVTGDSFKGNRMRIVKLVDPQGNVLFQRGAVGP